MSANPAPTPDPDDTLTRVGIRDLRLGLSDYLKRAHGGERIIVTDRGTDIAELVPRPNRPLGVIEQALAEGRMQRATPRDPQRPRITRRAGHPTVFETLMAMRDEDDR